MTESVKKSCYNKNIKKEYSFYFKGERGKVIDK
uniref:Uncharacterized protein n=1 Tax=Siphoviridae sp. ctzSN25 TaxID=2826529 RepID=A0A8S5QW91_9CAUD|nr:MAG TPA: hypothetical protein [Siphoviridae sp. ctzSN25]